MDGARQFVRNFFEIVSLYDRGGKEGIDLGCRESIVCKKMNV